MITVATHFARPLVRALRSLGIEAEAVMGTLAAREIPARVPHSVAARIWRSAVDAAGEPALGVVAAGHLVAGDYGLFEYLARSSPTLRVAAERVGRYHRLMNDGAATRLLANEREATLRYVVPAGADTPRAYLEFVLATWIRIAREVTEDAGIVHRVRLPFPEPRDRRPYERAFGKSIDFDAEYAEVVLDSAAADRPLVSADRELDSTLEQHAQSVLASRATPTSWRARVADAVRPVLADGQPRLGAIAEALAVPERTLRRRLADEGATFAAVVTEVRRSLALAMVDDDTLSLGEIAFLLGFSEPSAFHRAFRRWTGRTPRPPSTRPPTSR